MRVMFRSFVFGLFRGLLDILQVSGQSGKVEVPVIFWCFVRLKLLFVYIRRLSGDFPLLPFLVFVRNWLLWEWFLGFIEALYVFCVCISSLGFILRYFLSVKYVYFTIIVSDRESIWTVCKDYWELRGFCLGSSLLCFDVLLYIGAKFSLEHANELCSVHSL